MLMSRRAKTDSARKSAPGPSGSENTTLALWALASPGAGLGAAGSRTSTKKRVTLELASASWMSDARISKP